MFDQLEKLLVRAAFDPAFALGLVSSDLEGILGFGLNDREARVMELLIDGNAAGLRAILNVMSATRATTLALQAAGMPQSPAGGAL